MANRWRKSVLGRSRCRRASLPGSGAPGKRKRFREFWESVGSQLLSFPLDRAVCERAGALLLLARTRRRTVPLGDALHGTVAEVEDLTLLTVDAEHFKAMGVAALNPLAGLPRS